MTRAAVVFTAALAAGPLALHAQPAAPAANAPVPEDLVRELMARAAEFFEDAAQLPTDVSFDPAVRRAIEGVIAAHRERGAALIRAQVPRWAAAPDQYPYSLVLRARIVATNAVALLGVTSAGPEQDQWLDKMLRQPRACAHDNYGLLIPNLVRLAALPQADALRALAVERRHVERLGQVPQPPISRSTETWLQEAEAVILRKRGGRIGEELPLPPIGAVLWLDDKPRTVLSPMEQCIRLQWWYRDLTERRKVPVADALAAWRHASLPDPRDYFPPPEAAKSWDTTDKTGYPPFAAFLGISGTIVVEARVDADNRPLSTRIFRRQLKVGDLDLPSPVLFEKVLDEASLARAATVVYEPPERPLPAGETRIVQLSLNWKLD